MVLGISGDPDLTSIREDFFPFRHARFSVIGAFCMNRGLKGVENAVDVRLIKDHNMIHTPKCGNKRRSFILIQDRAPGSFQAANRPVAVDRHNERIAQCACTFEIAHVADVENIEAAVGKDDLLSLKHSGEVFERTDLHDALSRTARNSSA